MTDTPDSSSPDPTIPDDSDTDSTTNTVFVGIVAVFAFFGLVCCGTGITAYILGEWSVDRDADRVERTAKDIADFEVPDEYHPEVATRLDFLAVQQHSAKYAHERDDAHIEFSEMTVRFGPDPEELHTDDAIVDGETLQEQTVETREFEIRGETVEIEFIEARRPTGDEPYRHVRTSLPVSDADITEFSATTAEADYNEKEIIGIIESIE